MPSRIIGVFVGLILLSGQAFGGELFGETYHALFPEKGKRLTPVVHYCTPHCGTRIVQETRITCSIGGPAHLVPDAPIPDAFRAAWQIHEENWLIEEYVRIDAACQEHVTVNQETLLAQPQYWPEDDLWHPVSYYDTPLYQFNCGALEYDAQTNRTEMFIYRIVVGYRFGCS